jgi:hypothetical protein
MNYAKQVLTGCKNWLLGEKGFATALSAVGAIFTAVGIHRFRARPEHFGLPGILGCVAGAFGAFFLLLAADYLLHHARLVFIPWLVFLAYLGLTQPHFAVGLGMALGFLVVSQMRS